MVNGFCLLRKFKATGIKPGKRSAIRAKMLRGDLGFDGIVVTGRADRPVYLWIQDNHAEIMDGSTLWGQGTYAVQKILKETHGKNVRFVTTGVSGENKCRNATIFLRLGNCM